MSDEPTMQERIAAALILHDYPFRNSLTRPEDPLVMLREDPKFFVSAVALSRADAVLRVLAEHGGVANLREQISLMVWRAANKRAERAEADLAAARQQLDQVRAILAVLRDFIHPDQGNAATPYGDGKRYVAVRDIEQVLRLDAPARPAGHDESGQ
jgi:hypothetical protein